MDYLTYRWWDDELFIRLTRMRWRVIHPTGRKIIQLTDRMETTAYRSGLWLFWSSLKSKTLKDLLTDIFSLDLLIHHQPDMFSACSLTAFRVMESKAGRNTTIQKWSRKWWAWLDVIEVMLHSAIFRKLEYLWDFGSASSQSGIPTGKSQDFSSEWLLLLKLVVDIRYVSIRITTYVDLR
jgi:hypothetical protein